MLDDLVADGVLPAGLDRGNVTVEPPRDPSHGDVATNAAMVLAKAAGTNPLSAVSVFRVTGVSRNGGNVEVSFSSVAGFTYQLETSTTLANGSWSDAGAPLEAVGADSMISAPVDGGRRFYRVRVEEGE